MPRAQISKRRENAALFTAALLAAVGGLVYELVLGTAASYLVGDSVLSFSLATGITLFGMGLGSLLAPRLRWEPATAFAVNEILLGLLGGNCVLLLYVAYARTQSYWLVFGAVSLVIGVLIGLEIPLLLRTFDQLGRPSSVRLLSQVLALDYFGALVAALVFPLVLLPELGLVRGTYLVGAVNVVVALVVLAQVRARRRVLVAAALAAALLVGLFTGASQLERQVGSMAYQDPVIHYQQSAYQQIVLTRYHQDLRLYLNGQLQFSSLDEARYHETLAGAALSSVARPRDVLVLGGGDGLLARELLRWPEVETVTVVDIDPAVTQLARSSPPVREFNGGSLDDPRVQVRNEDAFTMTAQGAQAYDVVLIDLVDPSNERLAKLYSVEMYQQVDRLLRPGGVLVTQATSSFFSPNAFAVVASSVAAAMPDASVLPFTVNVPSFGEWGFVLATRDRGQVLSHSLPQGQRYQTLERLRLEMLDRPPVLPPAEPSTLLRPRVVQVYNEDMRQWRYY